MRIWDVPVAELCRIHLLGEHRELHALWTILTEGSSGYRNHPETKRWVGKLAALYKRHEQEVVEMELRGYTHKSPLDKRKAKDDAVQDVFIATIAEQKELLLNKPCTCYTAFFVRALTKI
jgi:hypothetical protein